MFGVLICVSEAALLSISTGVAEKRNTESGGKLIVREGPFKRAVLWVSLERPLFFQSELPHLLTVL